MISAFVGVLAPLCGSPATAEEAPTDNSFLSRVTIVVPIVTRHTPQDRGKNDANWGAWVDLALDKQWSAVLGDYQNSYKRNTVFGGAQWMPINLELSGVPIAMGGMLGLDLNGGYKGCDKLDPLLGAFSLRIGGSRFETSPYGVLNKLGAVITVIPPGGSGHSSAVNMALTYRF